MHKTDTLCDISPGPQDEIIHFCRVQHRILQKSPKNIRKPVRNDWFNGADGRIRTGDLILTKDALYLLSYISAFRISRTQEVLYYSQHEKAIGYWQINEHAETFYILSGTLIVFAQFSSSSA